MSLELAPDAVTAVPETKVALAFEEISDRIRDVVLPEVDLVVGIATGGIIPAALVAHQLGVPLLRLDINFRAPDNKPQRDSPELLTRFVPPPAGTRVLLVDDVSVTGQTLDVARALLEDCVVTSLVLKGKGADHVLFPEVGTCVTWPWGRPH